MGFPGYDNEEDNFDAETHCKYIFGGNVAEYMEKLKEDDEEAYAKQFSQYVKAGIDGEALEAMYEKCHDAIRADPGHSKKENAKSSEKKRWNRAKMGLAARKDRVRQKMLASSTPSKPRNKLILTTSLIISELITSV